MDIGHWIYIHARDLSRLDDSGAGSLEKITELWKFSRLIFAYSTLM